MWENFFIRQIDIKVKNKLLKYLSPNKIETVASNFYLTIILITFIDHPKIYMTLLVPKSIQSSYFNYSVHLIDFFLLHYLLSSNSKAMTFLIVPSLLTLLSKTFNKKKLN